MIDPEAFAGRHPILVVGLPRSGTTWIGEVLSSAPGSVYAFEPDNEKLSPMAWLYKAGMHRFPYLTAGDEAADYQSLWVAILAGKGNTWSANSAFGFFMKKRAASLEALVGEQSGFSYLARSMRTVGTPARTRPCHPRTHPVLAFMVRQVLSVRLTSALHRRLIIKSVHAPLGLEWITARFPVKVILVLRNPFSLYASYKRMRMPDGFRNLLFQPALQRDISRYIPDINRLFLREPEDLLAFQIMLMYKIIESQLSAHPEWTVISHDRLCLAPHDGYHDLFNAFDLHWSDHTGERIDTLNKAGKDFDPRRVSSQQPSKWKSEMAQVEKSIILDWIDRFDLHNFLEQRINLE